MPTATSYKVRFWLVSVNRFVELSPDGPVHGISITFDGSGATVSGLATSRPGHDGWYAFAVRAVNDGGASDGRGTTASRSRTGSARYAGASLRRDHQSGNGDAGLERRADRNVL